jgi:hypothetical protein
MDFDRGKFGLMTAAPHKPDASDSTRIDLLWADFVAKVGVVERGSHGCSGLSIGMIEDLSLERDASSIKLRGDRLLAAVG